jgi:hypothetical protein
MLRVVAMPCWYDQPHPPIHSGCGANKIYYNCIIYLTHSNKREQSKNERFGFIDFLTFFIHSKLGVTFCSSMAGESSVRCFEFFYYMAGSQNDGCGVVDVTTTDHVCVPG